MNTRIWLGGAAFAAATFAAGAAFAADAIATTDLNMRAGPGPQYPIVDGIKSNGAVTINGCTESGRWCDVTYGGTRGWAYAEYLAMDVSGERVVLPQAATRVQVPTATYSTQAYWDQNYRDRPFYGERQRYIETETGSTGAVTGAAGGAITGALVGGPIGAAVGGIAGAALGSAIDPPKEVGTYVTQQPGEPVLLDGEVVVGAQVPEAVQLAPVPQYEYRYAYVNGQRVLVDPASRRIVYVYR